jgi:hypothetical protein
MVNTVTPGCAIQYAAYPVFAAHAGVDQKRHFANHVPQLVTQNVRAVSGEHVEQDHMAARGQMFCEERAVFGFCHLKMTAHGDARAKQPLPRPLRVTHRQHKRVEPSGYSAEFLKCHLHCAAAGNIVHIVHLQPGMLSRRSASAESVGVGDIFTAAGKLSFFLVILLPVARFYRCGWQSPGRRSQPRTALW